MVSLLYQTDRCWSRTEAGKRHVAFGDNATQGRGPFDVSSKTFLGSCESRKTTEHTVPAQVWPSASREERQVMLCHECLLPPCYKCRKVQAPENHTYAYAWNSWHCEQCRPKPRCKLCLTVSVCFHVQIVAHVRLICVKVLKCFSRGICCPVLDSL